MAWFLKLDGIEGESKDEKHKGEIDIISWSLGGKQAGSFGFGGGGGTGKLQVHDLKVTTMVGKHSPAVMLACASGKHIKSAVLTGMKAGGDNTLGNQKYMEIKLTDVMVSSYNVTGDTNSVLPVDNISLNFAKVEIEHKEQKSDGSLAGAVKKGWDVKANKPA
jgi:type VI secretion system secreted protein Hcp